MTNKKRTAAKADGPVTTYILANDNTAVNLAAGKDIAVIFHPITDKLEDGYYNVLDKGGTMIWLSYTREGGWNTFRGFNGEIWSDTAIEGDQYIAWAETVPGCE